MNNRQIHDKIDLELSRAYFGNVAEKPETDEKEERPEEVAKKKAKPQEAQKKPAEKRPETRPSRPVSRKLLVTSSVILLGIALSAGYFIAQKYPVSFDLKPAKKIFALPSEDTVSAKKSAPKEITSSRTETGPPQQVFTEWNKHNVPTATETIEGGKTLYDFEGDDNGWEIPTWAFDKTDHVARTMEPVEGAASNGSGSLGVYVEFPGDKWSAAIVEIQQFLDLTDHDMISADIYLPPEAPVGLRAKIILTIGEDWRWTEMTRTARLKPGEWTTITADISEGDTTTWRRTTVDKEFKTDIRKIAVRVESNKPAYSGPIYMDNIRIYPGKK